MKPTIEKDRISHPAFGAICVNRVSGSFGHDTKLHASDFKHQKYISLEIHEAVINRQDSWDHHMPTKKVFEIAMTEAQWATFVSSFGQGSGVPCTLTWLKGQGRFPTIDMEPQVEHLRTKALERVDQLLNPILELEKLLATAKMPVGVRKSLQAQTCKLKQELQHNLPYFLKNFEEHMETTVEKAKSEVHAYISNRINEAGLAALQDGELLKLETKPYTAAGDLDQGAPNHFDPSKRGFQP